MASLFSPDIPQQDPAITRMQQQEQQRAEQDRIKQTQLQLQQETLQRNQRYGLRSLLGPFSSSTLGSSSLLGTG